MKAGDFVTNSNIFEDDRSHVDVARTFIWNIDYRPFAYPNNNGERFQVTLAWSRT